MFEQFTESAREVVRLAQEEARELRYTRVDTEAILLGLLHQRDGTAATVLASMGITLEAAHAELAGLVFPADQTSGGPDHNRAIPFTPRAKKSLELALRESLALGHNHIGTEHILLALLQQGDSVASRVLTSFEADPEKIRGAVLQMLSEPDHPSTARFANRASITMLRDGPVRAAAGPDKELRRLLMAAAERAVRNQKTVYGLADVLAAEKEIEEQSDVGTQDPDDPN